MSGPRVHVACGECKAPYDDANGFCPRCGAKASAAKPAPVAMVAPNAPGRRLVQLSGVLFLVLALFFGTLAAAAAYNATRDPTGVVDAFVASSDDIGPGGVLNLTVLRDGMPVVATVVAKSPKGLETSRNATDADGHLRLDLVDGPAVHLEITDDVGNVTVRAFVLSGLTHPLTVDMGVPQDDAWHGLEATLSVLAVSSWVFVAMCILMLMSGVAAIRLRAYRLAWGGCVPFVLLLGLAAFWFLSLGMFLVFALPAAALVLIVRGKGHFVRRVR